MLSVKLVYATLSLLAGFIVSILLDISSTFLFFLNGLPELLLTSLTTEIKTLPPCIKAIPEVLITILQQV